MNIAFEWNTELQAWQDLILQAEAGTPVTRLLWAWSSLECRAEEYSTWIHWKFHGELNNPDFQASVQAWNLRQLPEINRFRTQLLEHLQQQDHSRLDPMDRGQLDHALLHTRIQIQGEQQRQQEQKWIDQVSREAAEHHQLHKDQVPPRDLLCHGDESVRKAAHFKNREILQPLRERQTESYLGLVELRKQQARACGYETYDQLVWDRMRWHGFPYPLHGRVRDLVHQSIAPRYARLQKLKARSVGKAHLDPWDLEHVQMARRFQHDVPPEHLHQVVRNALEGIHPDCLPVWDHLVEQQLLDLSPRPYKLDSAYAGYLMASGDAVVVGAVDGSWKSLLTVFHEFAHVLHFKTIRKSDKTVWDMCSDSKFSEAVALFFEMVAMDHLLKTGGLPETFGPAARWTLTERILSIMGYHTFLDDFQQQVYQSPEPLESRDLQELSLTLSERYAPTSPEAARHREHWWLNLNLFHFPYYNMEYVLAWVGAVNLYQAHHAAPEETWKRLVRAMEAGGQMNFLEAMEVCGVPIGTETSDLQKAMGPVLQFLDAALDQLDASTPVLASG